MFSFSLTIGKVAIRFVMAETARKRENVTHGQQA